MEKFMKATGKTVSLWGSDGVISDYWSVRSEDVLYCTRKCI